MQPPDRVGTALWSIVTGASTGAAACAAALLLIPKSPDTLMFIFGGGLAVAVVMGWVASRGITDTWRRAVTAAICAFGATLLIIGTIVADLLGRALGIAAYGATLTVIAVLAFLRARAGAGTA